MLSVLSRKSFFSVMTIPIFFEDWNVILGYPQKCKITQGREALVPVFERKRACSRLRENGDSNHNQELSWPSAFVASFIKFDAIGKPRIAIIDCVTMVWLWWQFAQMLKYLSIYLSPATEVVAAENWLPPELEKLASQTFLQCAHSTHTYTLLNITLL